MCMGSFKKLTSANKLPKTMVWTCAKILKDIYTYHNKFTNICTEVYHCTKAKARRKQKTLKYLQSLQSYGNFAHKFISCLLDKQN